MKDKILNKWIFSYLSLVTCWNNGEVIFPATTNWTENSHFTKATEHQLREVYY